MKRKNFLLSSLLTIPGASFAGFRNFIRPKKGIKISTTESRFDGQLKSGDTNAALCKISSVDTDGDLSFFAPGEKAFAAKGGPPLHIHLYQDEIFYVVAGTFLIQVGDEQFHIEEGDTVFAPRQVPHAFTRISDTGKMITVFQPAGKMEDFFNKLNGFTERPKPEEFVKLFEEHDMKIVGPPLTVK